MTLGLRLQPIRRSRLAWASLASEDAKEPAREARRRSAMLAAPRPVDGPSPDLLHPVAHLALDFEVLRPLLEFAFAGGEAGEPLQQVLAGFSVVPSAFEPDCFTRHLFVDELVRSTCKILIDGAPVELDAAGLTQLLVHPPRDVAVAEYRRAILAELVARPELRGRLTDLYRELRRLRTRLMHTNADGRYESTRRRVAVLESIRSAIQLMASSFEGTTSGLSGLHAFGRTIAGSEAFLRLGDLLDHEARRATVALDLQLGADGRIRTFAVRRMSERTDSRYFQTVLERWLSKLSLWARGFGFSDEEVLDRWIDAVFADFLPHLPALLQLVGHLEFHLAALGFRDACLARNLEVCLPRMSPDARAAKVRRLFNPLLFAQGITPVPCDLVYVGAGSTTVVTGPNSGGKTRLLQALGLTQLLAQAGFFVPAAEAELREVPGLFCSLVQEEAFDQSEGRLGSELLRIRRVFEKAPPGALVILDELCSGTNPSEGEEIFMLVVSLLRELAPETYVTTHFLDFAARLAATDEAGLRFLQVELDGQDHPTYAFVPGVAHTSLAAQAAARLGVTRDELLALVRRRRA